MWIMCYIYTRALTRPELNRGVFRVTDRITMCDFFLSLRNHSPLLEALTFELVKLASRPHWTGHLEAIMLGHWRQLTTGHAMEGAGPFWKTGAVVAKTTPESSAVLGPTLQAPAAIGVRGDACRYVEMRFVTLHGTHAHIENSVNSVNRILSILGIKHLISVVSNSLFF
jgi:hypothetical protein